MFGASKDAYLIAFKKLLPRGKVFQKLFGSVLNDLMNGLLGVFISVHLRATAFLNEMDPRGALEMLPEWEKFAGLPDGCSLVEGTTAERRRDVTTKLTSASVDFIDDYINLARSLGYADASITEFKTARFGRARFGDRFGDKSCPFIWQLNLPSRRLENARFGDRFGTRFNYGGDTVLECRMTKQKPAHQIIIFNYGT